MKIFSLSVIGFGALFLTLSSISLADPIDDIRKNYYQTKKIQSSLKKTEVVSQEYSTEGAKLVFYENGKGDVALIEANFLGETGRSKQEYYFSGGFLSFLFTLDEEYNSHIMTMFSSDEELKEMGLEKFDEKKSKFTENRYYFHNNKLVKWLGSNKTEVPRNDHNYDETGKKYIDLSGRLLNELKTKK